jgi:hypothetical protein
MAATRSVSVNLAQPFQGWDQIDLLLPASRQRRNDNNAQYFIPSLRDGVFWKPLTPALKGRAKFIPTLRVEIDWI